MIKTTLMYTPWGWTQDVEELADGVLRVSTSSHGGLKLSRDRWAELPVEVRKAMLTPTFAEEDCEEPIVRTLLGVGKRPREGICIEGSGLLRPVRFRAPTLASSPWREAAQARRERGKVMTTTQARPRSLASTTTKLQTEIGNLYVTVSVGDDGQPMEIFGFLGKGGSFPHGVTELACRLISLHLRRGTPLEEIVDQCQDIAEMQPFWNQLGDGRNVPILGLGDGIAHVLKGHLKAKNESEAPETELAAAAV